MQNPSPRVARGEGLGHRGCVTSGSTPVSRGVLSHAGTLEIKYNGAAIDLLQVDGAFDIIGGTLNFVGLGALTLAEGDALVFAI